MEAATAKQGASWGQSEAVRQGALQPTRTVAWEMLNPSQAYDPARSASSQTDGRAAGPTRRQALNRATAAEWSSMRCVPPVFVLRVHAQSEFATQDALHERDIRALAPVEIDWRRASRHTRRRVMVERPLFAGYLFCEDMAGVPSLRTVIGVLTGCGGEISRLSGAEIAWLRALADQPPSVTDAPDPESAIRAGMRAQIGEGPLSGLAGVVMAARKGMAEMDIRIFGARRIVKVPVRVLEQV